MNDKKLSIIYVPLELGAKYGGTDLAPQAIRDAGLEPKLVSAGFDVEDSWMVECASRGQLDPVPRDRPFVKEIVRVGEVSAELVKNVIDDGQVALVIGGDHSVNLGAFSGAAAAAKGDIGMIYIDAHGDINTPATSTSHNVHGMHLAALLGFGTDDMINVYGYGAKLKSANLLHIAGKDLDQPEIDLIKNENIANYSINNLLVDGLKPLFKMIDDLAGRVDNIWVSFDLDSVDEQFAPGVGIQNKGGLTYRETAVICDYIAQKCNVIGLDIVECNPPKDVDNKTAALAVEVALRLLGSSAGQYFDYMKNV